MGAKNRERFDKGTIGAIEETPQGGIAVSAYLTRTGVFDYEQEDGSVIREYRPPEEVFNADSLATLHNAPLTNEHPSEAVGPQNFRRYNTGHVQHGSVKQDGDKVGARLIWQEGKTIDDIRAGRKREISCGYNCDVDNTSGVTADGKSYDQIQRNIRYNHVALVPDGRAGPEVRLRLDSSGNQNRDSERKERMDKEFELIGGVRHEVGTPGHADACNRRDQARKDNAGKLTKLAKERDQARADADAAKSTIAKLTEALKVAQSPARLDHAVKVRAAVITRASVALGQLGKAWKADGLTVAEIKQAAVRKYHPSIKLDGKSADYVNALFRAIPKAEDGKTRRDAGGLRLDGSNRIDSSRVPAELRDPPPGFQSRNDGAEPSMADYRNRRDDAEESRHRRPLAVSKSNPHREQDNYPSVQGSMLETMR